MYRYEKYWRDFPEITDPINPYLHIFILEVGSSDYGFNEGCHGRNVF